MQETLLYFIRIAIIIMLNICMAGIVGLFASSLPLLG